MRIKQLKFIAAAVGLLFITGCGRDNKAADLDIVGSMELKYAEQFSVDYCENGCSIVSIADDRFLIVPENASVPDDATGMTVIKQPVENIYVAASSAMDLFDGIGKLDEVAMTSTAANCWSIPNIREAVDSGEIEFIGKYSSPDYEYLLSENCGLAVESTMIYHTPEVKEQLEALGIPVIVERSSYETHPLGRMEWIKLYGLLTGDAEASERMFDEKTKAFEELSVPEIPDNERKTVAFFYVTSNGYVNIRKPADYVAKMIELAGGRYIFTADDLNIDDNALSTMNIQTETFYDIARDADILIYNSTIDGELDSIEQLIGKCGVIADFKAVRSGDVWCTGQNMFQQTTGAADMICDLNAIFTDTADTSELAFLHKLE
ncbi:iron complex transport system substrate-binding protein [Ruminococcus sp. YRD2003]|uniref:ABC transporter substrate-binding protein n=1 Tax=Ruminococcus sp. YRD2003 TaxID=1452313 RepID=UPI0008AEB74B|nr:iron complex transport system substrate-binding protein [Ruminococcus flavefaciens]